MATVTQGASILVKVLPYADGRVPPCGSAVYCMARSDVKGSHHHAVAVSSGKMRSIRFSCGECRVNHCDTKRLSGLVDYVNARIISQNPAEPSL